MALNNLETFQKKLKLRQIRLADFQNIVSLQRKCFPSMKTWTKEQLASQIDHFPDGQICVKSFMGSNVWNLSLNLFKLV